MKNHGISKKPLVFFLFFVVISQTIFSENPVSASLDVSVGSLWGTTHEFVLYDNKILSQLDWQENWAPTVSLAGTINVKDIFINTGLMYAIPAKSGYIEDTDHDLITEVDGPPDVTRYSRHTAFIDNHTDFSASVGYGFHPGNWILSPSAGIFLRNRKWHALDGYKQGNTTTILTDDAEQTQQMGTVLGYEQHIVSPFIGIAIGYKISNRFSVLFNGSMYPYLWVHTLDNHFTSGEQYKDEMEGGIGGKAGLSLYYYPGTNQNIAVKLNAGWDGFSMPSGSNFFGPIGDAGSMKLDTENKPKTNGNVWTVAIGIVLKVF
jgi:outer membrane protease